VLPPSQGLQVFFIQLFHAKAKINPTIPHWIQIIPELFHLGNYFITSTIKVHKQFVTLVVNIFRTNSLNSQTCQRYHEICLFEHSVYLALLKFAFIKPTFLSSENCLTYLFVTVVKVKLCNMLIVFPLLFKSTNTKFFCVFTLIIITPLFKSTTYQIFSVLAK
jgi:hypothetical protein